MSLTQSIPPGQVALTVPCAMCGGPIHTHHDPDCPPSMVAKLLKSVACVNCIRHADGKELARRSADRLETRSASWETLCPVEFRKPLDARLISARVHDRIMAWKYGPKGLLVTGATGLCKTRLLCALMHREHLSGKSCAFVAHIDFRREVGYLAQTDAAAMWRYANTMLRVDVLLFDDLGAGVLTPATEEAFEWVISKRTRNGKPILFSANAPETMGQRFSEERRGPIMRRIAEFTEEVKV